MKWNMNWKEIVAGIIIGVFTAGVIGTVLYGDRIARLEEGKNNSETQLEKLESEMDTQIENVETQMEAQVKRLETQIGKLETQIENLKNQTKPPDTAPIVINLGPQTPDTSVNSGTPEPLATNTPLPSPTPTPTNTSLPSPTPTPTSEPLATKTPLPSPTPVLTNTPLPSPTPTPTPKPQTFIIPGYQDAGVRVNIPTTGIYRFTIEDGAYSPWPTDNYPGNRGWFTLLHIYKNRSITWGKTPWEKIGPIEPDFTLGVGEYMPDKNDAISAAKGASLNLKLGANDYLIFVPIDEQGQYADNRGEIEMSITFLSQ
jgi:hypothetical protein